METSQHNAKHQLTAVESLTRSHKYGRSYSLDKSPLDRDRNYQILLYCRAVSIKVKLTTWNDSTNIDRVNDTEFDCWWIPRVMKSEANVLDSQVLITAPTEQTGFRRSNRIDEEHSEGRSRGKHCTIANIIVVQPSEIRVVHTSIVSHHCIVSLRYKLYAVNVCWFRGNPIYMWGSYGVMFCSPEVPHARWNETVRNILLMEGYKIAFLYAVHSKWWYTVSSWTPE